MKKILCVLLALTLAGLCLITGGCSRPDEPEATTQTPGITDAAEETAPDPPQAERSVTVMVYMNGSDLESKQKNGTADLEEMAQSGVDPGRVNLLVFTGGSEFWHNGLSTEVNTLLRLTEEGFREEKTFDRLSMGDPENLTRFLTYAWENWPADEFDLILWDHGNGPVIGYGNDKLYGNDAITLPELGRALADSPFGPENRLAFLGFDACLMASVEVACYVKDYADYLVASQEKEPGIGWNYAFLDRVGLIPTEALCETIQDTYFSAAEAYIAGKKNYHPDLTLSVTDLRRIAPLEEALDRFFAAAADEVSGEYNRLAAARVHTKDFARSGPNPLDLIDIGSLLDAQAERFPELTAAVRDALEAAVVRTRANIPDCSGLSLYYPYYNKSYYQSSWREDYRALEPLSDYETYLSRYEQIWLGSDLMELFEGELVPQKQGDAQRFTLQLTPEQADAYARGWYYILRRIGSELYQPVYMSGQVTEDSGLLTADFNSRVIYVGTEFTPVYPCFARVQDSNDAAETYYVFGALMDYSTLDATYLDIYLSRDLASDVLTVSGVYPTEEGIGEGKQDPVDLDTLNTYLTLIYPSGRYLTRTESGRILAFRDWPVTEEITGLELKTNDGVRFSHAPIYDDGSDYYLMFELMDTQGNNTCSELIPINLAPPPEVEENPCTDVEPSADGTVRISPYDGVSCFLRMCRDADSGAPLFLVSAVNETDTAVSLVLSDFVVNETILSREFCRLDLDAGAEASSILTYIPQLLCDADIAGPWSLRFTAGLEDKDTQRSLVSDTDYRVKLSDPAGAEYLILPYMDMRAERQTLLDQDGVTLTLMGAGFYAGYDTRYKTPESINGELTVRLLAENHSDRPRTISLLGMELNGLQFPDITGPVTLKPGQRLPLELTNARDAIDRMEGSAMIYPFHGSDGPKYEDQPKWGQIRSISSLSVPVVLDGEWYPCPVKPAQQGDGAAVTPDGLLLYEDENFTVWAAGSKYQPPEDFFPSMENFCGFWIQNKTGTEVFGYLGDTFLYDNAFRVGRNGLIYFPCPYDCLPGDSTKTVSLNWRDLNEEEVIFYSTDSFELPMELTEEKP